MGQSHATVAVAERSVSLESHLSAEDLAALIDGGVAAEQRGRVDAHLAACAVCRAELTAGWHIVDSAPRTRSTWSPWPIAGIAAAAIVVLVALPTLRGVARHRADDITLRAAGAAATAVRVIAPGDGSTVSPDSLRFVWRRDDGASYRLFVADSAGAPVWALSTNDTTARLPDSVRIISGTRYFWYVDALRSDGTSISSAPRHLSIRRR